MLFAQGQCWIHLKLKISDENSCEVKWVIDNRNAFQQIGALIKIIPSTGCGTVDSVVASNTRGHGFEYCRHGQFLLKSI